VSETNHPDEQLKNPSVRHEPSDASFRAILIILVAAMVFAAVVLYVILQFFVRMRSEEDATKKSPLPLAPAPSTALPREPRLEQLDRLAGVERPDIYRRETDRLAVLKSYGPTADKGYVHVPIDRAIDYLTNNPDLLPSRPAPGAEQRRRSSGLVDAGASNSGRVFRGGKK
jgi:hypothetical protein